ncbi:hypothetical protein [Streptomyces sp. ODS05-4]|uniref:hypothetical protein n=1 Tax=Streptomyces sp. ODS05-4 TaxID=2944939 RepID=UPI00210DC8C4|nr:hypothetical protein [Streptomyces sp. ODS05-4]
MDRSPVSFTLRAKGPATAVVCWVVQVLGRTGVLVVQACWVVLGRAGVLVVQACWVVLGRAGVLRGARAGDGGAKPV